MHHSVDTVRVIVWSVQAVNSSCVREDFDQQLFWKAMDEIELGEISAETH